MRAMDVLHVSQIAKCVCARPSEAVSAVRCYQKCLEQFFQGKYIYFIFFFLL